MFNEKAENVKKDRIKYFGSLVKDFDKELLDGKAIGDPLIIAGKIEELYWKCRDEHVRSSMCNEKGNIDHHKIASLLEYSIMGACLIRLEKHKATLINKRDAEIIRINAKFALYSAMRVLSDWNNQKLDITIISDLDKGSFYREHVALMSNSSEDIRYFPIFSNSATIYFVEKYCKLHSDKNR